MTVEAGIGGLDAACDDDLLRLTADGDRRAFRVLMDRHVRSVLVLAERLTASASEADEIAQETFLKVWLAAPRWRRDGPARFSTWLYRVALNLCLDRRRRRSFVALDDVDEPEDHSPGAFEAVASRQRQAVVLAAMAELPHRQRAALSLHYFSGLSAREAAEVLETSVSALESLLIRGKRTLRAILADKGVTGLGDVV